MENITVFSNRLDESNGIVENTLGMKTTAKKTPWFLRFAPKAKGIASFVQNLLTQKEGVRGGQVSAFFQSAAAAAVVLVGIGLFASPFLLRADHDGAVDTPQVNCIWVSNHGSIGFDVEFDVDTHPDSTKPFTSFRLVQEGNPFYIDREPAPSATLKSEAPNQGWLDIPGFDGSGIPIPYPGYLHSFDYKIDGERDRFIPFGSPDGFIGPVVFARVRVSLYVVLNSEGALESMHAWVDDGGDGYEVSVYYSAGGPDGPFYTFP